MSEPKPYQCRHIFTGGHQCGSPALRGEKLCFYHHASRRPAAHEVIHGLTFIALPAPDDLHAIQRGLCEVLRLCAANQIDDRHAATLLRGLSIASANLARIARQAKHAPAPTEMVQNFVHDPLLGTLAPGPNPETSLEAPLPDCMPVLTPVPTIEYIRSPEADAESAARWAKLEQELAAHKLTKANRRQSNPDPVQEAPQTTADRTPVASPVQTYPPANEDFGLQKKTVFMHQPADARERATA